MLEQDYLKDSSTYSFPDQRSKALNEYSSQLIRETIIPKLTKEINSSKRYAPLRQVYYSLILAQWFKQKFYGKSGVYSYLIDRHNLNGLTSKTSWSKTTYFNAYKTSFQQGEYNIKEPRSTLYGQSIRNYMSGGVALQNIPIASSAVSASQKLPISIFERNLRVIANASPSIIDPFDLQLENMDADKLAISGSPIYQQWKASVADGESKRDALGRILSNKGIDFRISTAIGDIADDFMELTAYVISLVPGHLLKERVHSFEFGSNPSGLYTDDDEPGSYSPEDRKVYIYQRSFAFWDAYALARIILHETGHGFEGVLSKEEESKISAAFSLIKQKISDGYKGYSLYLKEDDNILSLDNRKALIAYTDSLDATQFIAEFFREYILNGEELREKIQSQRDTEVREALKTIYAIYAKHFNKEYNAKDVESLSGILDNVPKAAAKYITKDYKQFNEFKGVAGIFYLRYGLTLEEYAASAKDYEAIRRDIADKTRAEFEQWQLKLLSTDQVLYNKLRAAIHNYAQVIMSLLNASANDAELQRVLKDFRDVLLDIKGQSNPQGNEYALAAEYASIVFGVPLSELNPNSQLPSAEVILAQQRSLSAGSPVVHDQPRRKTIDFPAQNLISVLGPDEIASYGRGRRVVLHNAQGEESEYTITPDPQYSEFEKNHPKMRRVTQAEQENKVFWMRLGIDAMQKRIIELMFRDAESSNGIWRGELLRDANGFWFLVSHSLEGDNLGVAMAQMDIGQFMQTIFRIADILHALHEKGITYQDVHPGNIYIAKDGSIYFLPDFGRSGLNLTANGNIEKAIPGHRMTDIAGLASIILDYLEKKGFSRVPLYRGLVNTVREAAQRDKEYQNMISFKDALRHAGSPVAVSAGGPVAKTGRENIVVETNVSPLLIALMDNPETREALEGLHINKIGVVKPGTKIGSQDIAGYLVESGIHFEGSLPVTTFRLCTYSDASANDVFHEILHAVYRNSPVIIDYWRMKGWGRIITRDRGQLEAALKAEEAFCDLFEWEVFVEDGIHSKPLEEEGERLSRNAMIRRENEMRKFFEDIINMYPNLKLRQIIEILKANSKTSSFQGTNGHESENYSQGFIGSSPFKEDSISREPDLGGIDMRALPKYTKVEQVSGRSVGGASRLVSTASAVPDKEWQEIERMANSGIAPSCERIREYLLSLQDPSAQADKVLACIADILRQEEEKACYTESSLREILVLLESGKPVNELRLALTNIQILAKEPQLIVQ